MNFGLLTLAILQFGLPACFASDDASFVGSVENIQADESVVKSIPISPLLSVSSHEEQDLPVDDVVSSDTDKSEKEGEEEVDENVVEDQDEEDEGEKEKEEKAAEENFMQRSRTGSMDGKLFMALNHKGILTAQNVKSSNDEGDEEDSDSKVDDAKGKKKKNSTNDEKDEEDEKEKEKEKDKKDDKKGGKKNGGLKDRMGGNKTNDSDSKIKGGPDEKRGGSKDNKPNAAGDISFLLNIGLSLVCLLPILQFSALF